MATSKKTTSKKTSTNKKKATSKTVSSKKNISSNSKSTRNTSSKKTIVKTTATKKSSKKPTSRAAILSTKEIVINNKVFKLPKRIKLESYSCIWKMYSFVNPKTKDKYLKKVWIVIGHGHKKYRKFNTQAEAIQYFRQLKKYAKMKIQSVKSKQMIRTVYTFFEMVWRGIDLKDIRISENKKQKIVVEDEKDDYVDEFMEFDLSDDEELEEDNDDFDIDEINKVIAETEGDDVIIEDSEEDYSNNYKQPISEIVYVEDNDIERVDKSNSFDEVEADPYAITEEINYIDDINSIDNTVEKHNTSLYELASNDSIVDESEDFDDIENTEYVSIEELPNNKESFVDTNTNDFDENNINLTQYNTALTPSSEIEGLLDGKESKKIKFIYWATIVAIALILSAIVVIAILAASNLI